MTSIRIRYRPDGDAEGLDTGLGRPVIKIAIQASAPSLQRGLNPALSEHPLLAANAELRRYALARLQALADAGYSPEGGVAIPDTPSVTQQAAAALLTQLLERTTVPDDLAHQLATVIMHLTRLSDAGSSGGREIPAL